MLRKILVLFETVNIRKEVVRYSTGLAKRTDSDLMFLIILNPNTWQSSGSKYDTSLKNSDLEKAGKEAIKPYILEIEQEGVKVTSEVCIGDPPSEFLKFMAKNAPFQTVIWGGMNPEEGKSRKMEGHWLRRVQNMIDCPLVVPHESHG